MATSSDFRTFQFTDNNEFRRYKHRLNESFGGLRLFIDNKSTEPDHNHKMWLKKKIEEYLTLPEVSFLYCQFDTDEFVITIRTLSAKEI